MSSGICECETPFAYCSSLSSSKIASRTTSASQLVTIQGPASFKTHPSRGPLLPFRIHLHKCPQEKSSHEH